MRQGWHKRTTVEVSKLYDTAVPIIAEWYSDHGAEVTLYADGMIESEAGTPIHLLAYVLVEWHAYQRRTPTPLPQRAA